MSVLNVNQINSQVVGKPPVISDASGLEVGQVCTAWVTFNGTTLLRLDSFNVASVTLIATGQYQINFTTGMSNTNFSVVSTANASSSFSKAVMGAVTTLSVEVRTYNNNDVLGACGELSVLIFGGK